MCLICDSLKNDKMTLNEARKNLMELRTFDHINNDHFCEVIELICEFQKNEDDKKTASVLIVG